MRYPEFYEHVPRRHQEHLDGRGDRLLRPTSSTSRKLLPAERHLINRLVAFFATGDSIVAEQPRAQPVQAHQRARGADVPVAPALRGGAARPVLPDAARHLPARPRRARRGVRGDREHPVDPGQGRVLLPLDRLDQRARPAARPQRGPQAVPAQPHLLRRLHRGAVLLRRLRLRLLPALARACSTAWPAGTNWVFRDESGAHGLRLRGGRHGPRARSRTCSTTSSASRSTR